MIRIQPSHLIEAAREAVTLAAVLAAGPCLAGTVPSGWLEMFPPVRDGWTAGAVYDAAHNRMIVVGPSTQDILILPLDGSPVWRTVRTLNPPGVLHDFRSAQIDSAGRRMLVVGTHPGPGIQPQFFLDVWSLSLDDPPVWTRLEDGGAGPHFRSFFSSTWDPVRRGLIVFGGLEGVGIISSEYQNVAFTFADGTWDTLRVAGTPPHGRARHTAVYDAPRDRILVFGGEQRGSNRYQPLYLDETWELTLSGTPTWRFLIPTNAPPQAREDHSAVLDLAHDRMLVYGGAQGSDDINTLYSLVLDTSGTATWTPLGDGPGSRTRHLAIEDPIAGRMLFYGGRTEPTPSTVIPRYDLWSLDLSNGGWQNLGHTEVQIEGRQNHDAVYDSLRDRMVVLPGQGNFYGTSTLAYSFENSSWSILAEPTSIGPYDHAVGAYDSGLDRIVAFVGRDLTDSGTNFVSVLPLDGSAWNPASSTGTPPGCSYGFSSIGDPGNSRMLIFGGARLAPNNFHSYFNDVWALSLTGPLSWTHLAPTGTPPSVRQGSLAAYDSRRRHMLVFGGGDSVQTFTDLWSLSLDGSPAWTRIDEQGIPPGSHVFRMIYDPIRDRLVAIGETSSITSVESTAVWVLPLVSPAWVPEPARFRAPVPRSGASAIYDPRRDRVVYFGGKTGGGGTDFVNDIWSLYFEVTTPVLASLIEARASADHVDIQWFTADPTVTLSLARRESQGGWKDLEQLSPDGTGAISYVDRDVHPGAHCDYRWTDAAHGIEGQISVDVPGEPALALSVRPNPAVGAMNVRFSLPARAAARLEVIDLAGRRVLDHKLDGLAAGPHTVSLGGETRFAPGLYLVRLTQAGRQLVARAAVVR